jgi:hypothetical protein
LEINQVPPKSEKTPKFWRKINLGNILSSNSFFLKPARINFEKSNFSLNENEPILLKAKLKMKSLRVAWHTINQLNCYHLWHHILP